MGVPVADSPGFDGIDDEQQASDACRRQLVNPVERGAAMPDDEPITYAHTIVANLPTTTTELDPR